MTQTAVNSLPDDLRVKWEKLRDLGELVHRNGFDAGKVLGTAEHEIRGMDCQCLGGTRYLVVAGDKLGYWYAATFDTSENETEDFGWRQLPAVPTEDDFFRVIDHVLFVPCCQGVGVVIGTRGNGAWFVPLDRILDTKWDCPDDIVRLPGSEGRSIRQLLFDDSDSSPTLLGVARNELFHWSLSGERLQLRRHNRDLSFQITALTIDYSVDRHKSDDFLYFATSFLEIYRFRRDEDSGHFTITEEKVEAGKPIWKGRLSRVEQLRPFSHVRHLDNDSQEWKRHYDKRGVIAATLRHLLLVYEEDSQLSSGPAFSVVRLVDTKSNILTLDVLNLPRWQGIAVATLSKKLRMYHQSGLRKAYEDVNPEYFTRSPESESPSALITGFENIDTIPDRIYCIKSLKPITRAEGDSYLPVVLGLGSNEIRLHRYRAFWGLRQNAKKVAESISGKLLLKDEKDERDPLDSFLESLQRIALQSEDSRRDRNALALLIPVVGLRCCTEEHWRSLLLLVWDVLAQSDVPSIPIVVIQALRQLQLTCPQQMGRLEETLFNIRKFVLDPGSFSEKRFDFIKLINSTDPKLEDERTVYRSILISRHHDPLFVRDFQPGEFSDTRALLRICRGKDSGEEAPEDLRFLAASHQGSLWLLDGTGKAVRLNTQEQHGHVRALLLLDKQIFLSFSDGSLRQIHRDKLLSAWEDQKVLLSFHLVPGAGEKVHATSLASTHHGTECIALWGDKHGQVRFLREGNGSDLLIDLGSTSKLTKGISGISVRINELEVLGRQSQPADRNLLIAGTASGHLFLIEWDFESASIIEELRVGNHPISSMLVTGPDRRDVVVACDDGTVTGLRLVKALRDSDQPSLHLAVGWGFHGQGKVSGIRSLHTGRSRSGQKRPYQVIFGSHDENFYILDLEGHSIATYWLPGTKIGLFATTPRFPQSDDVSVLARIYTCSLEDRFQGLRLIDLPRAHEDFNSELHRMDPTDREATLTRCRAYRVREGHLRHRFILQSCRYPGDGSQKILDAIERLLNQRDISNRPSGEMTALLRRLYQLHLPGEKPSTDKEATGLAAILANPKIYVKVLELQRKLLERWGAPSSKTNRRVQLYWIRSLLHNVRNLTMLRQWLRMDRELGGPRTSTEDLIRYFLEKSDRVVQVKTLEYLERLFFGWPGVAQAGLLVKHKDEILRSDDVDWLLQCLYSRLRLWTAEVSRRDPDSIVLRIGRFLRQFLQHGYLDPLYLSYQLQRYSIHSSMYTVLIDQCSTLADRAETSGDQLHLFEKMAGRGEPLLRFAEVINHARSLDVGLQEGADLTEIILALEKLINHAYSEQERSPDTPYLREFEIYYQTLIPLLRVETLRDIHELAQEWKFREELQFDYCPSYKKLRCIPPLLEAVGGYWVKKWEEGWRADPGQPLKHLEFEDFALVLQKWEAVRRTLVPTSKDEPQPNDLAVREARLLRRLTSNWAEIFENEQYKNLLYDFQVALEFHLKEPPPAPANSLAAIKLLKEEASLALAAFSSLFVRLILLAEPSRAAFLYADDSEMVVKGKWFSRNKDDEMPPLRNLDGDTEGVGWLYADWMNAEIFKRLSEDSIYSWLAQQDAAQSWRIKEISGASDQFLGFFIFGWPREDTPGCQRFDMHRLAWEVPLQALLYRQAAMQQQALRGRIFSMVAHNLGTPLFHLRSDLKVLVDGFFEGEAEKRMDKYGQLLRQARHLDGIVNAILSLDDRDIKVTWSDVQLQSLVYDVVRLIRKESKHRGIDIDFPPYQSDKKERPFRTDEAKLYDILLNLIVNAVKYSPVGGSVSVRASLTTKGAAVIVEDKGPGIPGDERTLIYEPFFRGASPKSRGIPGLGLGLYVVKLYVDALNGRINLTSDEQGSEFTVFLPNLEEPAQSDSKNP